MISRNLLTPSTLASIVSLTSVINADPGECRGVLAAQVIKPQARVLAEARGIHWVEVDLAVLRGEREPDLRLFVA